MRLAVESAPLGRWIDPSEAWWHLCEGAEAAFWLDSGPHAASGMSYLGVAASVTTTFRGPVLEWLREQAIDVDTSQVPAGFALGWIGWLGYELRGETMGVAVDTPSRYPDAAWMFVDRCLAFDHAAREVTLLALHDVEGYRAEVLSALAGQRPPFPPGRNLPAPDLPAPDLPAPDPPAPDPPAPDLHAPCTPVTVHWAHSDSQYVDMIEDCQAAIREGDAYQLCLTTEARIDVSPDPFATYLALRDSSPTHHGALIVVGSVALLSATPEQFLAVSVDGIVRTKPIKGTRPRGITTESDEALRDDLESSAKERAENLMIVDLMRNDLARICRVGSVTVTELLAVESYAQVHQLVSTVQGVLAPGLTAVDALAACFPAGSMTGAPKRSATEILARLERRARGIYSGVFGYVGLDGAIDLAMVIRSIVIDARGATVGAGGGITALSVPAEELAEVKLKAAALLRVLGAEG